MLILCSFIIILMIIYFLFFWMFFSRLCSILHKWGVKEWFTVSMNLMNFTASVFFLVLMWLLKIKISIVY